MMVHPITPICLTMRPILYLDRIVSPYGIYSLISLFGHDHSTYKNARTNIPYHGMLFLAQDFFSTLTFSVEYLLTWLLNQIHRESPKILLIVCCVVTMYSSKIHAKYPFNLTNILKVTSFGIVHVTSSKQSLSIWFTCLQEI